MNIAIYILLCLYLHLGIRVCMLIFIHVSTNNGGSRPVSDAYAMETFYCNAVKYLGHHY